VLQHRHPLRLGCASALPRAPVLLHCSTSAAPHAVRALDSIETPPLCCLPEGGYRQVLINQSGQRHQPCRSRQGRNDETVEVVVHGAGGAGSAGRRCHTSAERPYVMLADHAGAFPVSRFKVRRDLPYGLIASEWTWRTSLET
jgi:hypothetical protein